MNKQTIIAIILALLLSHKRFCALGAIAKVTTGIHSTITHEEIN